MTGSGDPRKPILPGATLGVLGGGQLGRMFALAARRMGYRVAVFAPGADGPAAQVADHHERAGYDDLEAVTRFARSVAAVTFEFENVPAATAEAATSAASVRPSGRLLHTTQQRLREKTAVRALGVPTAPFWSVSDEAERDAAAAALDGPGVLKTAGWGYDGKGQRRLGSAAELSAAWEDLERTPAVLEGFVPFEREISVVGARGVDGEVALYEPFENDHSHHVLDVTLCPARVSAATRDRAHDLARKLLEGLDVVGVLCVELFAMPDGELVVNELAPRPHNSGHLTIEAHATSQFEQQVRALCGLPLGSVAPRAPVAAMANLLGDLWSDGEPDWTAALARPGVALHLYGKGAARPGRKMGHLTVLGSSHEEVGAAARSAREALRRPGAG